jgi:MoxR-like ATPase
MQEQQVTVDGVTRALPRPFLVLATQNPIEYEGTFPLPEAQLDRFLMRLPVGYPSPADERSILTNLQREHPINRLNPVDFAGLGGASGDDADGLGRLTGLQKIVWEVHVDDSLQDYIVRLVGGTRSHPDLLLGGSPRASLALFKTAQALAAVRGRDHVIPDDVKYLVSAALSHRLIVRPEAELRGRSVGAILQDIVASTPLDLGSYG